MTVTLLELCPPKPVVKIDDNLLTISLVTLQKEIELSSLYGSLADCLDALHKDKTEIVNIIWVLLEEKHIYKNSVEVFKKELLSGISKTSLVDKSAAIANAFNNAFHNSMPVIKNAERQKILEKIREAQEEKPLNCYATYYGKIAKRYPYTLEQFLQLTSRQINMLLKTGDDEAYKEFEMQAALHGRKMNPRMEINDISEEQEAEQDAQAMQALKTLQEKYRKNQEK